MPDAVDDGGSAAGADDDPVAAALAGARRMTRSAPARARRGRSRGRPVPGAGRRDPRLGGLSGAHPDEHDPSLVGELVSGYVADRGWQRPLAEAGVFANWAAIVGADVAAHCSPASLRDGELRIAAESTAWATQLRLLAATLRARLAEELGPEVVTRVVISGPVAPSWKHGPRSVRGARGPRDTYG